MRQKIADAPMRLEKQAYVAFEDEFIAVATVEDLRVEDRLKYEKVRDLLQASAGAAVGLRIATCATR